MAEYINTETGEVVDSTTPRHKSKVASVRQYVGMDTKYPSECVTQDSLLEALRNLDACLHYKPDISYDYLTESLMEKLLTVQEVAMLTHICKTLCAWNYWMGSSPSLKASLPGVNIARTLKSLEGKGLIRITHRDKPFRHDIVLKVNPMVAFKGGFFFRAECGEYWHKG